MPQVRYWSMCNNLLSPPFPLIVNTNADGSKTVACLTDSQAVANSRTDRRVTLVVSRPYLRPATARNW